MKLKKDKENQKLKFINTVSYQLIDANESDTTRLMEYKLKTILDFADNLSEEDIVKIRNYVRNQIPMQLKKYKMIQLENKIIGCLLVEDKDDGKILDELYIEKEYRGLGIGTCIIQNILQNHIVYLWVYKANIRAIALYKRLGFHIVEQTDTRYYMKYSD